MQHSHNDKLCGGILFVLLLDARGQRLKPRETVRGKRDGLSNTDVLLRLIQIAQPDFKEPKGSFDKSVSNYKQCLTASGDYLPFDRDSFKDSFTTRVTKQYGKALKQMQLFVDEVLDKSKLPRLAGYISALIAQDQSIKSSQKFQVSPDGTKLNKEELAHMKQVTIAAFLLSVWYYIITSVPDNTLGRETYKRWHIEPSIKGKTWMLDRSALPSSSESIEITDPSQDTAHGEYDFEDQTDTVEGTIVDDEEPDTDDSSDTGAKDSTSYTDGRVVVFQGGTNNTNIGHIETLNLNR